MIPPIQDNHETNPLQMRPRLDAEEARPKGLRILLATTDSEIRRSIDKLLQTYNIDTVLASGLEEIKSALAKKDIKACFCGFWLVDGTYRDVVRYLRHQRAEIPVVIVCAPTCPHEYMDYLSALKIRAFDFICHPYRQTDMERILHSPGAMRSQPAQMAT
jgi:DNA-binding NtrC family response regulator